MSIVQFGVPLALFAPFMLATWIAFKERRGQSAIQDTTLLSETEAGGLDFRFDTEIVDVEEALRQAAAAAKCLAGLRSARIDLAVAAAMTVLVNSRLFGTVLREAMLSAIGAASGGQVLVTAAASGSQVHIRVCNDGAGADQQVRETSMRQVEALISLQGGSIAVEAQQGRGTTVTIQLPLSATVSDEKSGPAKLPVLAELDA